MQGFVAKSMPIQHQSHQLSAVGLQLTAGEDENPLLSAISLQPSAHGRKAQKSLADG
jgi:hypothetical protein